MSYPYSIEELLNGCLKKQSKYQRALVDRYSGLLYVIANRYMNNGEQAQDLLQDSLVKIFKNLDKYEADKGSFDSWISTITIRLCLTKISRRTVKVIGIDEESVMSIEDDKSKHILDQMETDYLVEMIKELPDGFREIFNMAVIDGFKHVEIASYLEITPELSRKRLSIAKALLRKRIINLNKRELWANSI